MKKNAIIKNNQGAAMLIVIIVITAVALIMSVTVTAIGLGELEMGYSFSKAQECFSIADSCMDETFYRLLLDSNYGVGIGTILLTLDSGTCEIDVTADGSGRTVVVKGISGNFNKKIQADITLSGGSIIINSWGELDN